jgi:hypothetical protein
MWFDDRRGGVNDSADSQVLRRSCVCCVSECVCCVFVSVLVSECVMRNAMLGGDRQSGCLFSRLAT